MTGTEPLPAATPIEGTPGKLLRAVPYATPAGFRPLLADVHMPPARRPPVVLFLHGGGWRLGSRTSFCPTWRHWSPSPFARLVAAGFAVVSADYRLSAEAAFPAQLDDVTAAARWIRDRAADLGVDAERIVAWGESAGGHLAALLGLTATRDAPDAVAGVVDWYGPSDLNAMPSRDDPGSREAQLLGAAASQVPDLARAASPASQVHAAAPPFHLAHGTADDAVPAEQSRALTDALRAAGRPVECELVPEAGHLWRGPVDGERIFTRALEFAQRVTAR
ncbi:alpha/beta hydrolase [Saccharopolyspora karakumensis]|uniref:Alpha/beta hydrolase n=1 Tax=Saccharopolyspora karakumensis TaxID=2530386 RepID=A0A4R5BTQ2_9PSEU|nr:alpha/beta hydrolase [Saccharopolyspora karakumensis]TDD89036.1 alpha/beta hydrolase [Saccharopolyspora karakumensis]